VTKDLLLGDLNLVSSHDEGHGAFIPASIGDTNNGCFGDSRVIHQIIL
jgi:hypothetical protein